jgi:hypothetical protein
MEQEREREESIAWLKEEFGKALLAAHDRFIEGIWDESVPGWRDMPEFKEAYGRK